MRRTLLPFIQRDLSKKIVLITGPRQTGKTTLAKLAAPCFEYLNYDHAEHRLILHERSWDRKKDLVIMDELHKMKKWKRWLKGIYDAEGMPPGLLVTGSAKLDTARKVGDSLAGRFFEFRLHPFDVKEILAENPAHDSKEVLRRLLQVGGFPEPYLEGAPEFYGRWKRSHLDIILKQDLPDLEHVQQIAPVETLIHLLRKQVGSLVSYSSLARDLQTSDKTIKRWLAILENMYVLFRVPPFHRNIGRAILKSPKYYFYDTGQVLGDEGSRLENAVACALLKEIHFREDCWGEQRRLCFLRNKEGQEVDFVVLKDDRPSLLVEVKWAESNVHPALAYWGRRWAEIPKIQVVAELGREKTFPGGVQVRAAGRWLAGVSLP